MYFRSRKKSAGDISLSEALDTDGEGNSLSFMDVLAQDDELCELIGDLEISQILRKQVDEVLDEREAKIIKLRYGLYGMPPKTQHETAKACNISRSYVSRIEKRALAKLKESIGEMIEPS